MHKGESEPYRPYGGSNRKLHQPRGGSCKAQRLACRLQTVYDRGGEREKRADSARRSGARRSRGYEKLCRGTQQNAQRIFGSGGKPQGQARFAIVCGKPNIKNITGIISDELGAKYLLKDKLSYDAEKSCLVFGAPPRLDAAFGVAYAIKSGEKASGDTHSVIKINEHSFLMALSDGMGSGKSAAVESRMVVQMFRRLIGSGVNYQTAIKLINSVMVTKSPDETFATLDAVCVDLDTCGLTVIKSGASATLIRHRGNVMKVVAPTFPIGIYSRSETFSCSYEFEEGDIIIMFSDGISETEYRFIKELLMSSSDIKKIVDEICAKADVFNPTLHTDDITVIGIRACRSSE